MAQINNSVGKLQRQNSEYKITSMGENNRRSAMPRMIFTVTIDVDVSLQPKLSDLVTPEFLERTLDTAIAKAARTGPDHLPCTVRVAGGGPLTEMEQSRVWLREMLGRLSHPR